MTGEWRSGTIEDVQKEVVEEPSRKDKWSRTGVYSGKGISRVRPTTNIRINT